MLITKFETKSMRVKGLSFHPSRPWILASLHSGVLQIWDYRIRTLLERFDEHDGPVRGVCFHPTQPLFVSGGDDYKIKVWNYKLRRCLYTLLGHLDYIRTVQFHHEHPWILSSSDDQTIRIWNWQSRQCISILTGHNHYVMCANFHPKEDLVVSASLDQTVRVWDVSGLRKKNVAPGSLEDMVNMQGDLFGNTDAVVKYTLPGHDRGVNWAAFSPNLPLLISGADDRQIKVWRMNDTKAWEVDTLRGHFNNVSCVLFHPRRDLILSNSEDKTIRVWDMTKRCGLKTYRREHDRFWILAAHPELNLFAAGHDGGMLVFKLERERPAYGTHNGVVYYVRDHFLRAYDTQSRRDVPLLPLRRRDRGQSIGTAPRLLAFNPAERAALVWSPVEGGTYELYQLPRDKRGGSSMGNGGGNGGSGASTEGRRGSGVAAVWVARNRFAVLTTHAPRHILVRTLHNEITKKLPVPPGYDTMFAAGTGRVLLGGDDKVALFDLAQRKVVAELSAPGVKLAVWSQGGKDGLVALVCRETIVVADRKLSQRCVVHESCRVKSGAWDENGAFIYSTLNHIKFLLPNGDHGSVLTLDTPIYITCVRGSRVHCLDREARNRTVSVLSTEYRFKLALHRRQFDIVLKMVQDADLIGQSIIAYLQRKGFPEVAFHLVRDERTRFDLALDCGNIEAALASAKVLDEDSCWRRLGAAALRQGNHQMLELAYQRTKDFERLSFLYLITGNIEKLRRMLKIAVMRSDVHARFHNALYLGDAKARAQLLAEVGQLPLAYVCARTHGLDQGAVALARSLLKLEDDQPLEEEQAARLPPVSPSAQLLIPPTPITRGHDQNWPLLTVRKGPFVDVIAAAAAAAASGGKGGHAAGRSGSGAAASRGALAAVDEGDAEMGAAGSGWGGEDDLLLSDEEDGLGGNGAAAEAGGGEDPGASGWDDDLDLDELDEEAAAMDGGNMAGGAPGADGKAGAGGYYVVPSSGFSPGEQWVRNSRLAADHAAAGHFTSAMKLLHTQVGAVNFGPLREHFLNLHCGAWASVPSHAALPPQEAALHRNWRDAGARSGLPALCVSMAALVKRLKLAYRATFQGRFQEALRGFQYLIHACVLMAVENRAQEEEVCDLLRLCSEYAGGLRIELARKELQQSGGNAVRVNELAAYFTNAKLQPVHLILALRAAMTTSYKCKNFASAAHFGRRLLDLNPKPEVATQATKVVKVCERKGDDQNKMNFDPRNPYVVCGYAHVPIYQGNPTVRCPLCSTSFMPEHKGKLCPVCEISEIGASATGLLIMNPPSQRR